MADPTPTPHVDEHGVPRCNREVCPLFDGKRCRETGFEPDLLCEPEVRAMARVIAHQADELAGFKVATLILARSSRG